MKPFAVVIDSVEITGERNFFLMKNKTKNIHAFVMAFVMTSVFLFNAQSSFADSQASPDGIRKKDAAPTGKTARIILVLDASSSMCQDLANCPGSANNDPMDKRVDGANAFVDSIACRCPTCEIGVIVYIGVGASDTTGRNTVNEIVSPVKLNAAENILKIHNSIRHAGCNGGIGKIGGVSKIAKRTLTFTGLALDSAIKLVDAGYDSLGNRQRHIVLLTDGDWQKPTPTEIFAAYALNFPNRKLPTIHGVFISDSATHVAAGFPPQGAVACDATDTLFMNMSFFKMAVDSGHGLYFPGTTPQTIVATFDSLVHLFGDTVSTSAGFTPISYNKINLYPSEVAWFDATGKLLRKSMTPALQNKANDFQGVYFVKYLDGKIERRINVLR